MIFFLPQEAEAIKSDLDRERLVSALEAINIGHDEETISRVKYWLDLLLFAYQTRKNGFDIARSKPSKEFIKLNEALSDWINSDKWRWEAQLLAARSGPIFPYQAIIAVESFAILVSDTIKSFESKIKPTR